MNKLKKMADKWFSLSLPLRTSIAIMTASFFQSGMKLLFVPVFTRIMSTSEYGVVTTFESIQSTLATVTMFSLSASVYSRGMQEFKDDRDTFTSSLLFLSNMCTLFVGAFFVAFSDFMSLKLKLPKELLLIMFIIFIFLPAYNFYIARSKFEYKYRGMLILTMVLNVLAPVFSVVGIFLMPANKVLTKILAAEIVLGTAHICLYIRTYMKSRLKVKWKYVLYALKFNLPLLPHYASQQVLSSSDRIMISSMVDHASAGIYGLSYQVSTVVHIVWSSINSVLVPWEYDKIEENKVDDIRRVTKMLILFYGAVCVGIMFVAPEVIRIFSPSSFHEGIYLMPPVIGGIFFSGLYSLLAILEFYFKKNLYVMFASLLAAILNIVLNYIFIPIYGYQAAAYTTLVCYMIYAFLHALNLKRLKLSHYYDMKFIFLLSCFVTVVSLFIARLYDGYIIRYGFTVLILAVAFVKRKMILDLFISLKKKSKK